MADGREERAVRASVVCSGLNGGELLLTDWNDVTDTTANKNPISAFENLKSGQYIMVCGPHPSSGMYLDASSGSWKGEPKFVMNWYQVISIEPATSAVPGYDSTGKNPQRIVTVRGPQWPWQPASASGGPAYVNGNPLSANLCAAICKGVVAVHTKTMRLEGASDGINFGSASGDGTTGNPQNPYKVF